jgi:hypothetical protein
MIAFLAGYFVGGLSVLAFQNRAAIVALFHPVSKL